jgi:hypothetical protein
METANKQPSADTINLLLTDESAALRRKFIQTIRAGNWLQSNSDLGLKFYDSMIGSFELFDFEGTIVELFALLSH